MFKTFTTAMTALGVKSTDQLTVAKRLCDLSLTSLQSIIKFRRFLEYQVLRPKKPPDRH